MESLIVVAHQFDLPTDIVGVIWGILCELPITFVHAKIAGANHWDLTIYSKFMFQSGRGYSIKINKNIFKYDLNKMPQKYEKNIIYFSDDMHQLPASRQITYPIIISDTLGIEIALV